MRRSQMRTRRQICTTPGEASMPTARNNAPVDRRFASNTRRRRCSRAQPPTLRGECHESCHRNPRRRPRTSPRSSSASRRPGPAATSRSSAPRCRSSASRSPKRSTCAPANACSTSPPATAMRRSPRHAASPRSPRPTTCRALLDKGRERARAEGLPVQFQVADAEQLPFADGSFDVVLSTFGAMFTPEHGRAAREMLRVVRDGGRIGMANWTPEGFIGRLFKVIGAHLPPPAGLKSPALWGTEPHLVELFGPQAAQIRCERRHFNFRYRSAAHWVQVFRDFYGPTHKAFAALEGDGQAGAGARHHAAARPDEHRRRGIAGRARRVPRGRDHQAPGCCTLKPPLRAVDGVGTARAAASAVPTFQSRPWRWNNSVGQVIIAVGHIAILTHATTETLVPASKRRIGIIGIGFGAQVYVPGLQSEGWEVAAVCSRNRDKATQVAQAAGIARRAHRPVGADPARRPRCRRDHDATGLAPRARHRGAACREARPLREAVRDRCGRSRRDARRRRCERTHGDGRARIPAHAAARLHQAASRRGIRRQVPALHDRAVPGPLRDAATAPADLERLQSRRRRASRRARLPLHRWSSALVRRRRRRQRTSRGAAARRAGRRDEPDRQGGNRRHLRVHPSSSATGAWRR